MLIEIKKGYKSSGSNRVNRGGNWNNTAPNCSLGNRNNNTPQNVNNNIGFRSVVCP
jgi:formylglycine-generating enzyme required for sulfatase activity